MKPRKLRISAASLPWLIAIDQYIRQYNITGARGLYEAASDVLDGWALRHEIDDLVRRKLLTVVPTGESDYRFDMSLCGMTWTVGLTDRAIAALWPHRALKESP